MCIRHLNCQVKTDNISSSPILEQIDIKKKILTLFRRRNCFAILNYYNPPPWLFSFLLKNTNFNIL